MRAIGLALAACLLFAPRLDAQTHLIVITGLSGAPRYAEEFHELALALCTAAQERGVGERDIIYLAERVENDPERIAARSTWGNIESVIRDLADRAAADDVVFIVLIGHGTMRDGVARFGLPGPDPAAADFAALLELLPTQTLAFVNVSSASGDFIASLSGPNRAIVTATKSGHERNETVFGRYFVEAYAGDDADADKDERVSLLEAFQYARREVERHYRSRDLLQSEHARLDDNGDGVGVAAPEAADGRLAASLYLGAVETRTAAEVADPELARLYAERRRLEERVAELRARKDEMEPESYERELEAVLLELALKTREIRELEEKG